MAAYFGPGLFTFLKALEAHNDREWFQANREQYVAEVEAPMLRFITDLAPHLATINPSFVVDRRRVGGSMHRIHRDTRFSADKSPYKTHVSAIFPHAERKRAPSVPGFYLHLQPGFCMGGGGIHHPDSGTLTRIRLAIAEQPAAWAVVKKSAIEIQGATLKRAPAGFAPTHPSIDDLRRKDFYALVPFTEPEVCGDDFLERYIGACHQVAPLVAFLTRALGWRW